MKQYVAFLRGINVGGNNIIKMETLRGEFERIGYQSVRTYIQSGNVIFHTAVIDKNKIEIEIEKALSTKYDYKAKVLVRSKNEMENTVAHFPKIFSDPNWKHNVIFLSSTINSKDILTKFDIKKEIEQLSYFNGVLYWSANMASITRSVMIKLSARKEYKEMTVRNVNTTNKILAMMNDSNE
ncbi:MAG: hypothetical protein COW85_16020 [Ignavibacteria bacterium CG22_combo_CG10-13_8_21_14_all_37_15]|nr:DUF1697 domain-containing protein [Ignavibacteria bacterium]OIO18176.1 MAG: hypothetical protein AUJ54_08690 [Ignavibacteria bacterium CG1_02_37_35]PIP76103.1 MAG: hypothetical protein COW85_16020 [Ignavibacteria bacterium CG22_combo_CG10-13_8_21_14_all_37_15]PIS44792.1 MAG: hypothetical protein COT22_08650 [Ignavibacteria bacterium CG08_land_8_20_14_0_20_37_9]PJC59938.1 MAG: hypothetical protein CO025_04600 [Ignavibacteria bacterium CG_4_9_14_0_2_um_filter_37_13]